MPLIKQIPILEVEYKRIFTPKTNASVYEDNDLRQAALNSFEGRISLRGLLESQSGKYVCRHYNSKLDKNSYTDSANLSVFIPGILNLIKTLYTYSIVNKKENFPL